MARVPFIGRLFLAEYFAIFASFLFLIFESFIRACTVALPNPVIRFFYYHSRWIFNALAPTAQTTQHAGRLEKSNTQKVRDASGFVEMCEIWGYRAEEHVVRTEDGYLLGVHRVMKAGTKREDMKGRKVVYLHHGLLMNSEVWVCLLDKDSSLPFQLAELGYDVWLGNNRGNKYSKKHLFHSSNSPAFWDFSIDQFAMHDIPDSISYILKTTGSKTVSFIGFSQGTAQAFAALSISPLLNEQVDVMIGLGPAMNPAGKFRLLFQTTLVSCRELTHEPGLHQPIVDAFIRASPNVLYLLFGRKSILSSATFWQSILYPPLFVNIIDASVRLLFNWQTKNITLSQKIAAYAHLYSFTSVKSVVHWFQIIRNKCFQMYDDDLPSMVGLYGKNFYKVPSFPTKNISSPICLFYGGSDSLVDIQTMLKELPEGTQATEIPHYEHLDFLWAHDVHKLVHPHVIRTLEKYSKSGAGDLFPVSRTMLLQTPNHLLEATTEELPKGEVSLADYLTAPGSSDREGSSVGKEEKIKEILEWQQRPEDRKIEELERTKSRGSEEGY
ncbi:alpha/beta-hydrolase [Ascobolus immersus RN42]|uniref:Alpha/beta-hydrolase n=1 Tax=Ascobolus immersus RN42 TaxID=1160509 RepID=A0A3N4IB78_ASCIM|nr:alpha/beta-hydrolase [Ascobolus immersus RN42]